MLGGLIPPSESAHANEPDEVAARAAWIERRLQHGAGAPRRAPPAAAARAARRRRGGPSAADAPVALAAAAAAPMKLSTLTAPREGRLRPCTPFTGMRPPPAHARADEHAAERQPRDDAVGVALGGRAEERPKPPATRPGTNSESVLGLSFPRAANAPRRSRR